MKASVVNFFVELKWGYGLNTRTGFLEHVMRYMTMTLCTMKTLLRNIKIRKKHAQRSILFNVVKEYLKLPVNLKRYKMEIEECHYKSVNSFKN